VAIVGTLAIAPAGARPAGARAAHVILVSIDGLMPAYYREPERFGLAIPVLRELAAAGSSFAGAEGVFPTVTYPNHTAVITGTLPVEHGIDGNTPLDPFNRTREGWYWYAEDLKVPALWDVARQAGRTAAAVYWPVTVGAKLDVNFPEYRRIDTDDDVKLLRTMATPGLVEGIEKQYGRIPGTRLTDTNRAQAAAYIIEHHRPNLLLVHLTDLDGAQHGNGPASPEALKTLEQIDRHLGFIRDATRRAGIADQTAWVIVSDHGFRRVSRQFNPRVLLRSLGYLTYNDRGELADWRVYARISGGTFALVAKDPSDATAITEATAFFEQVAAEPRFGIAQLYSGDEARQAGGFPGAFLVGEAADDFLMGSASSGPLVTPSGSKGAHGYHPSRPDQLASLLLSGKGIAKARRDETARLIDVAPTVAHLLGFTMPTARGTVLAQALTAGASNDR
jgi:predicted AlkP superfamily pyrophosphatase or phosphodiesterase